jgi:hypothetical protein
MDPMIHAALCVRVFIDYFSPKLLAASWDFSCGLITSEIIYISDFLALLMMIEPTHFQFACCQGFAHKRIS